MKTSDTSFPPTGHAPANADVAGEPITFVAQLRGIDSGAASVPNVTQYLWGEERYVTASDWPHPAIAPPMVDDGDLVEALLDACSDAELQQVLVDNPAQLYWST